MLKKDKDFKFEKEEVVNGEKQWTFNFLLDFVFKKEKIKKITITDHFQKKQGREMINLESIINITEFDLNGKLAMRQTSLSGNRKIYVREWISYQNKNYRLIFWFKDGTTDHLWIRNCYRVN